MAATKGNQFWKARAKHGRSKIFSSPNQMWLASCEYFQWIEDNPLSKAIVYQGELSDKSEPLMRAMTIDGLTRFLHVNIDYLNQFESALDLEKKQGKDFSGVIHEIKSIIRDQKFAGASAGLLNANIIARDLGLSEKKEVVSTNANYEIPDDSTPKEAMQAYLDAMRENG